MPTQQSTTPETAASEELRQPPPEAAEAVLAARDDRGCTCLYAVIDGPTGVTVRSQGVVSSLRFGPGVYQVIFNRNVRNCAYVATIGDQLDGQQSPGEITMASRSGNNNGVFVTTHNSGGAPNDRDFHLIVICRS